jgi:hypothetical protein
MDTNFVRCRNCGYHIISEELETHQCKKVVDYRIEKNILWLSDGERWFPQKLLSQHSSPKSEHPKFTPEDGTEPNILYIRQ